MVLWPWYDPCPRLVPGCLQTYCQGVTISPSMRTALTNGLQNHFFASLNNERKVEVCSVLLDIGAQQGGNIVRVLLQNIALRID
jgi:hypothetical protein